MKISEPGTFGAPSFTLGTSFAEGSNAAGVRNDATLALFDATVPETIAFGQSAAAGDVALAARRDHEHGMASTPSTRVGGTTSEATTTSTSLMSLQTVGSLSIAVGSVVEVRGTVRKTAGASASAYTTIMLISTAVLGEREWASAADTARSAPWWAHFIYGRANYLLSGYMMVGLAESGYMEHVMFDAAMPTGTLTAIIIRGRVSSGSIEMGAQDMHVYSEAVT